MSESLLSKLVQSTSQQISPTFYLSCCFSAIIHSVFALRTISGRKGSAKLQHFCSYRYFLRPFNRYDDSYTWWLHLSSTSSSGIPSRCFTECTWCLSPLTFLPWSQQNDLHRLEHQLLLSHCPVWHLCHYNLLLEWNQSIKSESGMLFLCLWALISFCHAFLIIGLNVKSE